MYNFSLTVTRYMYMIRSHIQYLVCFSDSESIYFIIICMPHNYHECTYLYNRISPASWSRQEMDLLRVTKEMLPCLRPLIFFFIQPMTFPITICQVLRRQQPFTYGHKITLSISCLNVRSCVLSVKYQTAGHLFSSTLHALIFDSPIDPTMSSNF